MSIAKDKIKEQEKSEKEEIKEREREEALVDSFYTK